MNINEHIYAYEMKPIVLTVTFENACFRIPCFGIPAVVFL